MKTKTKKTKVHNVKSTVDPEFNAAMKIYDEFDKWLETQDKESYWDKIKYEPLVLKKSSWLPHQVTAKEFTNNEKITVTPRIKERGARHITRRSHT